MAIICTPGLTGLLLDAECRKGNLLTKQEVEDIRDRVTFIYVPDDIARNLDPFCGYGNIEPQKCWDTWSEMRALKPYLPESS